jgi:hypothetical protein
MMQNVDTVVVEGLLAGKEQLLASIIAGTPAPVVGVKRLALKNIYLRADVFQHRSGHQGASEKHIEELTKALLRNPTQALEPVTIYWIGDGWCCIDGHHRLEAYKKAKYVGNIPVRVFSGGLENAIAEAMNGNARDKLPMARHEKSNAAWRVVLSTPSLTRATQVSKTTVCLSTIKTMNRVAKQLTKERPYLSLDTLTWWQAMSLAKGIEPKPDNGWDERKEAKVVFLVNRLCKHFGTRLTENIEITAEAFSRFNADLLPALAKAIRGNTLDDDYDDMGLVDEAECDF